MNASVSLIIPTLNAESEIGSLIESLENQSVPPDEIIVIDSSSDDQTTKIASSYRDVTVETIERANFNHGLTRDFALKRSSGDIVCFMTQDAVPANNDYLKNLINPILMDQSVAISSGRQLPKENARRFEQLIREYNYAPKSNIRSSDDVPFLGIKTYFATDVCSAYRRNVYDELGGFGRTDINEDMLMAAKAVNAGWKVAYAANAEVFHSHNLTLYEQYKRNYKIGRFLEENAAILASASEIGEGTKLVKHVAYRLFREGNIPELLAFSTDCVARLLGNRLGRRRARRIVV